MTGSVCQKSPDNIGKTLAARLVLLCYPVTLGEFCLVLRKIFFGPQCLRSYCVVSYICSRWWQLAILHTSNSYSATWIGNFIGVCCLYGVHKCCHYSQCYFLVCANLIKYIFPVLSTSCRTLRYFIVFGGSSLQYSPRFNFELVRSRFVGYILAACPICFFKNLLFSSTNLLRCCGLISSCICFSLLKAEDLLFS